ncbi:hypothetical protein IFR05_008194 [Cadophora sp. M221]|nr:hypothetical protein IFR05_008194 [Cadophora sp. M221]
MEEKQRKAEEEKRKKREAEENARLRQENEDNKHAIVELRARKAKVAERKKALMLEKSEAEEEARKARIYRESQLQKNRDSLEGMVEVYGQESVKMVLNSIKILMWYTKLAQIDL